MNSLGAGLKQFVSPNRLITIDKKLLAEVTGNVGVKGDELKKEFNSLVAKIEKQISNLKTGGIIIHGSEVGVDTTFGSQGRSPLGSVTDLRNIINRDLIVGVQSQPLFMGSNEAVGETHAIEQRKAYGRLIRRSQKPLNNMITYYFNLVLTLNGLPPLAEFRLNYENTAEYKDQALTFLDFHMGLEVAAESLSAFNRALDEAKESGYINDAEAQALYDQRKEIERQLNIIPQEL